MSTAAPSPSLRNLFSELEQLFHSETEARVSTSVQAAERALAEHLNQSVRRLRQAEAFPEIAAILCDASVPFAKSCGVFHVSENTVGGERLRGATPEQAENFSLIRFPASAAAAFAGAIESQDPVIALCTPAEMSQPVIDAFAATNAQKAHLFPMAVSRVTVGLLFCIGDVTGAALELLTQTAALALETHQRSLPALRSAPPAAANLVTISAATPAASTAAPDWDDLTPADRRLHLRAQRFARVQVAEMRLYRSAAVASGRARQNIYASLQDSIDQARAEFRRQFIASCPTMVDYLHLELVRTLANGNPAWLGGTYPGRLV